MNRVRQGAVAAGRATFVLAALLGLLAGSACDVQSTAKSAASLTYTEDAHKAYQEAMESFNDKHWEDAKALFKEVRKLFAYSRYARLAELRLADIEFEQGNYSEARELYEGYAESHRGDENIEYAKYRVCKSLYLDISDTILLPPQEERDQDNARNAYRELRSFYRLYPRSRYLTDAAYMLEVVTQRLVRHELYVARYYLRSDNFVATIARVDYALKHYPGSGLDAEALVLKGETLLKKKQPKEAREVFELVISDYGGPFAQVAKGFLTRMDQGLIPRMEEPAKPAEDG